MKAIRMSGENFAEKLETETLGAYIMGYSHHQDMVMGNIIFSTHHHILGDEVITNHRVSKKYIR